MPSPSDTVSNQTLNEILVILERSLPMYLTYAVPWVTYGNEDALRALQRVVAENNEYARRLTELLDSRRHTIDRGEFPMEFTSLHDVALGYLVKRLVQHQRQDILAIESRLPRLAGDPEGRALAQEIVAGAQVHLQLFESLAREPAGAA